MNTQVVDLNKAAIRQGDYCTKLLLFLILLIVPGAISPKFQRDEVEKHLAGFKVPPDAKSSLPQLTIAS